MAPTDPSPGNPITTDRLELVPASVEMLETLVLAPETFPARFGWELEPGWDVFPDAIPFAHFALMQKPDLAGWWMHLIGWRETRRVIGVGGFKGPPDEQGEVEIGYAVTPSFQRRGVATETVRGLGARAWADPRTTTIRAHTAPGPGPSAGVLVRCGFTRDGDAADPEQGPVWRWVLPRPAAGSGGRAR